MPRVRTPQRRRTMVRPPRLPYRPILGHLHLAPYRLHGLFSPLHLVTAIRPHNLSRPQPYPPRAPIDTDGLFNMYRPSPRWSVRRPYRAAQYVFARFPLDVGRVPVAVAHGDDICAYVCICSHVWDLWTGVLEYGTPDCVCRVWTDEFGDECGLVVVGDGTGQLCVWTVGRKAVRYDGQDDVSVDDCNGGDLQLYWVHARYCW